MVDRKALDFEKTLQERTYIAGAAVGVPLAILSLGEADMFGKLVLILISSGLFAFLYRKWNNKLKRKLLKEIVKMKISELAGNILVYVYEHRRESLSSKSISDISKNDLDTINEALEYLQDKNFVDLDVRTMDGNYHSIRLLPEGIDLVENNKAFEKTFAIGVNFGIFSASWGTKSKR